MLISASWPGLALTSCGAEFCPAVPLWHRGWLSESCFCPSAMEVGILELCRQELPLSKQWRVAFPCGFRCCRGAA